jgi:hypothetical protein
MPKRLSVSPEVHPGDAHAIRDATDRLIRRTRALAVVEAAGWAVAVGVVSRSFVVAAGVGACLAAWRWRRGGIAAVVRTVERIDPSSRNVFLTAHELLAGTLTTSAQVRARVLADAAAVVRRVDSAAVASSAAALRAVAAAALALGIATMPPLWRARVTELASAARARGAGSSSARVQPLRVRAMLHPPAYTGLKQVALEDPDRLQAIAGSTLVLAVESPADMITVDHDGAVATLGKGADRGFTYTSRLATTGFIVVAAAGTRRTIPVVVSPDALPSVTITAPARDLVYSSGDARIEFAARAADDFGLRSLRLRYTKVSGSGENFSFEDGEIPLALTRTTSREWSGGAVRTLADLHLQDGDTLVYRAVATDARDEDGAGSSDAFFIEVSKLGAAAGDAFTLPEEETRYALSQQMLIVKTERLQQRRPTLAAADVNEEALNLAVEQRMVRAEFVFMLGGEVENEEVEAEQSNELQEGRLQNRGQRDLRAATIAMSQAEKLLTAANLAGALGAERAAVAALQRAFARGRYILRALAARSALDLTRRLTGVVTGAAGWRRSVPDAPANRRAALLEDLLHGVSSLGGRGALEFAANARVLAEEAMRIDSSSAALRDVATELQRAAGSDDRDARTRAVATAARAAAAEAARAHADPTWDATTPAPRLEGAFAEAIARLKPSRSDRGKR